MVEVGKCGIMLRYTIFRFHARAWKRKIEGKTNTNLRTILINTDKYRWSKQVKSNYKMYIE
jgi:hypothetical protein